MVNNLEEFKKLVQEGKIKDKWYFYKRTEKEKQAQTEELPYLIDFFIKNFNTILYPIYGTLLGIIRNNDYILHDNDVDLAYLSNFSDKKDIINEYNHICEVLNTNQLLTKKCSLGQCHSYSKNKTYKFDIWTSFIINKKLSIVPLIDGEIEENSILPFKKYIFRNISILIPNKPKKILSIIYNSWETPIYSYGNNRGIKNKWKKIL